MPGNKSPVGDEFKRLASTSQNPVGFPVLPRILCEVRTIRIFIFLFPVAITMPESWRGRPGVGPKSEACGTQPPEFFLPS